MNFGQCRELTDVNIKSGGQKNSIQLQSGKLAQFRQRDPGEENGYPLQYSWQENPMDRGAWWAIIHGVTKSSTQLRNKHLRYAVEIIGNKLILLTCFECVVGRSRASFSVGLV